MIRLGVLGDPLPFTFSPVLHRAGLEALGLEGESEALRTPLAELGSRLDQLARGGWRGVNLTHPLKEEALLHVARVEPRAERARSVNTIRFDESGRLGDSTDGSGFLDFLLEVGRVPGNERVVLLGAGGAARSVAEALLREGTLVAALARDPQRRAKAWEPLGTVPLLKWGTKDALQALDQATVVVNATPLSAEREPLDPAGLPKRALVVDLVYGPQFSGWSAAARAGGRDAWDGLGLLVHQARRAFAVWCGVLPPVEPMARAVGWPR